MRHYTPDDLTKDSEFELLKVVDQRQIKSFIYEQIYEPTKLLRYYGIYQIAMLVLYVVLLAISIWSATRGVMEPLWWMLGALVFSFSVLIVLHELFHAVAYRLNGVKKLKAGALWRKFIFYVAADRQVVDFTVFKRVALAPFLVVNLLTIMPGIWLWEHPACYFFFSLMCLHSLFCAGDIAMLSFYYRHADKTIYNFDDLAEGKTFFYTLKKAS
ncbi:DUF3267 domain-containing protein [Mangrovibacterium lignilyticum]|uniref:DUF3267 domain-containing protein n=1 Tax=Mangrovibacterium lignilyticum TaxID=2668052 RepID=UPI0013D3FFB6|nr:DUF3267 domain-containing protein [Mangrovibacterium lignilyticum]